MCCSAHQKQTQNVHFNALQNNIQTPLVLYMYIEDTVGVDSTAALWKWSSARRKRTR